MQNCHHAAPGVDNSCSNVAREAINFIYRSFAIPNMGKLIIYHNVICTLFTSEPQINITNNTGKYLLLFNVIIGSQKLFSYCWQTSPVEIELN